MSVNQNGAGRYDRTIKMREKTRFAEDGRPPRRRLTQAELEDQRFCLAAESETAVQDHAVC